MTKYKELIDTSNILTLLGLLQCEAPEVDDWERIKEAVVGRLGTKKWGTKLFKSKFYFEIDCIYIFKNNTNVVMIGASVILLLLGVDILGVHKEPVPESLHSELHDELR